VGRAVTTTLREYLSAHVPASEPLAPVADDPAAELHALACVALLGALAALEAYGVAPAGLDAPCVDPLAMLHPVTDSASSHARAIAGDLRREAEVYGGRRARVAKGSAHAIEAASIAVGRARSLAETTAPQETPP